MKAVINGKNKNLFSIKEKYNRTPEAKGGTLSIDILSPLLLKKTI